MRQDRDNNRERDNLEKSHDRNRDRPLHEDYNDRSRRPVYDDVTDTLSPPARRDGNGGNNR